MTNRDTQMSVMDAINGRRSVRSYTPGKLDAGTVRALLAAAVRAPTAIHQEPWSFLVLQDPAALKRLSDRAKVLFREEVQRATWTAGATRLTPSPTPTSTSFMGLER